MKKHQPWLLLLNAIFNIVMGFILPINTLFITKTLHQSMIVSGLILMIYSSMMMIGNSLGGYLFDHYSHRNTLISAYFIAAFGFLALVFWHTWPLYEIVLAIIGLGIGIAYTAINSYTSIIAQQQLNSQHIFNTMYLSANIGIALGSMLVGIIFPKSIFLTFFFPTMCFVIGLIILIRYGSIFDNSSASQTNLPPASEIRTWQASINLSTSRQQYFSLFLICTTSLIIWLGYSQWQSNMSLYMLSNHFKMKDYSLLFSLNALSLLIIQPNNGTLDRSFAK